VRVLALELEPTLALAEVELGLGGHVGDLEEVAVEGDADDGWAFGGFDTELGF